MLEPMTDVFEHRSLEPNQRGARINHFTRRQFVKSTLGTALVAASLASSRRHGVTAHAASPRQAGNDTSATLAAAVPAERADTLFRSDMSQCQPAAALSRSFERGRWQLVDYETMAGVKGTMASAGPEDCCGTLTLPLNAEGMHRIYLGINYTRTPYHEWSSHGQLEVKLSRDAGFRRVAAEAGSVMEDGQSKLGEGQDLYKSIQEAYWQTADLTGQSLMIRQPQAPYNRPEEANISSLAYVKLVPVSAAEQQQWRKSQPTAETRRLAVLYCTAHLTGSTDGTPTFHPTSRQWFADDFAAYTNSDIKLFAFEAMRGNFCLFKTRLGDVGTEDNRWPEDWVDPLAAFTGLAHEHGMRIFASLRMIGPQYPTNRAPIGWARHYWRHPEWTKRDRDGTPVSNLSLAFPGVRQYWLSLLREALAYGIDGIQLHLNRSTPFVLYEEPVVRSFQEKHGEDPRKLPATDPRWIAHCAGFVTQFVREVRALVNEQPGRELGVTVFGPTRESPQDTHFKLKSYVCDVETWLKERLVDYVMPSQYIELEVLRKWRALAGDAIHLWPDLMPRTQPAASYARLAQRYYAAGADGFCLWDGERRHPHLSEWAAVRQLGHKDLLAEIIRDGPSYYRRVPLKKLGGFSVKDSFRDG